MDVTDALVARVPEGNVRVPMDEFVGMWRMAERWYGVWMPNPVTQGRIAGIVEVCRWLAGVSVEAPVTRRPLRASVPVVEAEVAVIEEAMESAGTGAPPAWAVARAGWADGAVLCFAWAWLGAELPICYFDDLSTPGA